ncbi:MAG TPA: hypothetical protein PLL72_03155 [Burkholderiaceae bacterium]|nr:hypothetical protein [Burkholderiaceae bacterium]
MPIAKGARVRQVVPVIEGEVIERRFSETHDQMEYHVVFPLPEGEVGARWFLESQIAEVPAEEAAATTEEPAAPAAVQEGA